MAAAFLLRFRVPRGELTQGHESHTRQTRMTKTGEAARPIPTIEPETLGETWLIYQKQIIVGAILIAASVGGLWLWRRSGQIREEKASVAYQSAEATFSAGNKPLAQSELEKITTRYTGTASGTQASMLMAQILFDQGKYAEGITQLQTAAGKAPAALRSGLEALIAGGQEGSGKSADAAATFGKAASLAQFRVDRDMYRMDQARNLVAAGDPAAAMKIYEEIGSRDDSPYAGESKVRLGELTVKR